MRRLFAATAFAVLLPFAAYAQSAQELAKGYDDTKNVLNYGMGYNLQRFSPLAQINKETVKKLVPVWSYSYDDNRSE
jgi:alcohol dehydrogenase (cytochrome c)